MPTALELAIAQLLAGFVIAGAITLGVVVLVDAHRAGLGRIHKANALEARDLSRLDRLDGLDTRRDA